MTSWNPNIPQPTQSPSSSQPFILINNQNWPTIFGRNHVTMNNNNQGKHGAVIYKTQTALPSVTGDWGTIFSLSVGSNSGTNTQLFYRTKQFVPGQTNSPMQFTFNQVNLVGADQQSFIMGGYLVYFGTFNLNGGAGTNTTITLSPQPASINTIQVSYNTARLNRDSNSVSVVGLNNFQFKVTQNQGGGPYTFTYFVIGTS